ncbi:PIN domain-containing protein [Catelliglobosispora koreensis]|uniref:PIN domain-containing protein n=1 Tax=Catelliglobosispora koreensis TaxID=129052 RepID=UPI000377340A|nr:PIN domain-containing protein [Catelliglobosispora koreensis]
MLPQLLPGADRRTALSIFTSIHTSAVNLRGGGGHGNLLGRYLDWSDDSAAQLRGQVPRGEIDRLIFTDRHRLLWATRGAVSGLDGAVAFELDERIAALESAKKAINDRIQSWQRVDRFLALDTTFFLQHDKPLRETNFHDLLDDNRENIQILVPLAVVDELDRLKEGAERYRARARYSIAVLDDLLQNPGLLLPEDGIPAKSSRETRVEVIMDRPGHVRLADADDEIVDRIATIEPFTGKSITLFTFDTGMALRARAAGLTVAKFKKDPGPEQRPRREDQFHGPSTFTIWRSRSGWET